MQTDVKENKKITGFAASFLTVLLGIALWIAVWEIASLSVGIEMILPSPLSVFKAFSRLIFTENFLRSSAFSMLRVVLGFAFGAILGAVVAFLCFFVSPLGFFFSPAVKTVRATPVSSFILIAVLWMPSGAVPVFIALLMVFPIVYENVFSGLESTDKKLSEVAEAYSFPFLKKLKLLYLPSALPYLASACASSLGLAWKAGVAAEVLCVTKNSIGKNLYTSNLYFETPELFAWTVTVIILSVLLEGLMKLAARGIKKITGVRYAGYKAD